jgi:hypothetical protein
MKIERVWSMPNKNTFEISPIKELLRDEVGSGVWIRPVLKPQLIVANA